MADRSPIVAPVVAAAVTTVVAGFGAGLVTAVVGTVVREGALIDVAGWLLLGIATAVGGAVGGRAARDRQFDVAGCVVLGPGTALAVHLLVTGLAALGGSDAGLWTLLAGVVGAVASAVLVATRAGAGPR